MDKAKEGACATCGARLTPQLIQTRDQRVGAHLCAEVPVRLACATCHPPDPAEPGLAGG